MRSNNLVEISFTDFKSIINYLNVLDSEFIFRGMADSSWRLKTSINRFLDDVRKETNNPLLSETNQNIQAEFTSQVEICKQQSIGLNKVFGISSNDSFDIDENTFLFLQVVLQHYEFPTRLLDWTTDFRIALYFCLEDVKQAGDVSVWAIKKNKILNVEDCIENNKYLYEIDMPKKNKLIKFYQRLRPGIYSININNFSRIKAQKGIELVTGVGDDMDFQDHLLKDSNLIKNDVIKINISCNLRSEIREYITSCGFTKDKLYPDDITDGYLQFDKVKLKQIMLKTYTNLK